MVGACLHRWVKVASAYVTQYDDSTMNNVHHFTYNNSFCLHSPIINDRGIFSIDHYTTFHTAFYSLRPIAYQCLECGAMIY